MLPAVTRARALWAADTVSLNSGWHFDLKSAIIGGLVAWLIAGLLYTRREALKSLWDNIRERFRRLSGRLQANQEERYLRTLQEALQRLLLFVPPDPDAVFIPPGFLAPAPLPAMPLAEGELPPPIHIPFDNVLQGYSRLLFSGKKASGRTMTLAMLVWEVAKTDEEAIQAFTRFPLWIDLAQRTDPQGDQGKGKDKELTPLERWVELATHFLPQALPKFILDNLKKYPSLILVDNWEAVPQEERRQVAQWIADVAQALPDSVWIVATGSTGYGPLVERHFVPLHIKLPSKETLLEPLYAGWAKLLGRGKDKEIPDELFYPLQLAALHNASALELTMRIVLYLRTGQTPERPIAVLETLLERLIPKPKLGNDQTDTAEQAHAGALRTLAHAARRARLEGKPLTKEQRADFITSLLPPEDSRPPKLEVALHRTLQKARVVRDEDGTWVFEHYVWEDFFTAYALVQDSNALSPLEVHLYDPTWPLIFECYVGLGDAAPLVKRILEVTQTADDKSDLLRAARWAGIADTHAPWRKAVLKALAQAFAAPVVDDVLRLDLGRCLALLAGEQARTFFLQALRHPHVEVRATALRGIGWVGSDKEMEILEAALQGTDLDIQRSAVLALAELGTPDALRLLYQGLSQADERVMLTISEALAETPEGWAMLRDAADSADLLVRRSAAHGLGFVKQVWAADLLVKMVREDPEWLVQSAANAALQAHASTGKDTTTVTPPPLKSKLPWLSSWAAKRKLSLGSGDAVLDALVQAAEDESPATRTMVAYTLAYVGRWDHINVLNVLLVDEDPTVRHAAEQALRMVEERYDLVQER